MDPVVQYLKQWEGYEPAEQRLPMLIEAYHKVRGDERLKGWRFAPGRQRPNEHSKNPMHCAFAATPFDTDDWFILRLVKRCLDKFSIGFCLDYGVQDRKGQLTRITYRRRETGAAIKEMQEANPALLPTACWPKADKDAQPHAFKGFEWKFQMPSSADELADRFVRTVLEWERLFRMII